LGAVLAAPGYGVVFVVSDPVGLVLFGERLEALVGGLVETFAVGLFLRLPHLVMDFDVVTGHLGDRACPAVAPVQVRTSCRPG
jgi:hypothetical protein